MNTNQALIQALNNRASECNNCSIACFDDDNIQIMTNCIKVDMDFHHLHCNFNSFIL